MLLGGVVPDKFVASCDTASILTAHFLQEVYQDHNIRHLIVADDDDVRNVVDPILAQAGAALQGLQVHYVLYVDALVDLNGPIMAIPLFVPVPVQV